MVHVRRLAGLTVLGLIAAGWAEAVRADVSPQKMFAISSVNFRSPDGRTPKNNLLFFDVTDVGPGGPTTGVFNNDPLFSVFIGLDYFQTFTAAGAAAGTEEDISAFTANPVNGTIYAFSFNQTTDPLGGTNPTHGDSRATNDTAGDFDLWRIDYQTILDDFVTNNRARGTIYAPEFAPTTVAIEQALADAVDPRYDGTADGKFFGLAHEESVMIDAMDVSNPLTVRVPGTIEKIGEVGRAPTERPVAFSFFNHQIEFINPATLLRLDGPSGDTMAGDHQIRVYNRVNTAPGMATIDVDGPDNIQGVMAGAVGGDDDLQGGWNRGTTESWESKIIGRLQMDGADRSDGPEWAFVRSGSTMGVWVAESDAANTGDDLSFFEINFTTPVPTVSKKDLFQSGGGPHPTFLDLDEDPSTPAGIAANDGEFDNLLVDKNGKLIVIESGFGDAPQAESKVYSVGVANYNAADSDGDGIREIVPTGPAGTGFNDSSAWSAATVLPITGAIDDDALPTDTRFVAFDRGTGFLYIVDADTTPANSEDIYVFDTNTGTIVYSEFQPFDTGILNKGTLMVLLRGDVNEDGAVNGTDIDLVFDAINDPTLGGTVTAALGKEWYDLTGDGDLTVADADEMVRGILGTQYGDQNLDGLVNAADLAVWKAGFGTGTGWSSGDNDGDGDVDGGDFLRWQRNVGFNNMAPAGGAVPEPGAFAMALAAIGALSVRRRR